MSVLYEVGYYGNGGYGYGIDWMYILVLAAVALSFAASLHVRSVFRRFSQVGTYGGVTGAMTAEHLLRSQGITDVAVSRVGGELSDHYDPRNKEVRLSDGVYSSSSVAAVAVAAHECGHVMQHAAGYVPLSLRTTLVPVVNFSQTISWPLILVGLIMNNRFSTLLLEIGILMYSAAVLFQLVTLPVEFNASSRALKLLSQTGLLQGDELKGGRKVLTAAALTYVASASVSILQLMRLMSILGGRRRD